MAWTLVGILWFLGFCGMATLHIGDRGTPTFRGWLAMAFWPIAVLAAFVLVIFDLEGR
jgi:hypothetical protein